MSMFCFVISQSESLFWVLATQPNPIQTSRTETAEEDQTIKIEEI